MERPCLLCDLGGKVRHAGSGPGTALSAVDREGAQTPEPPGVSPTPPSASVTPSPSVTPTPSVTPASWRRIAPLPMRRLQIDSTVLVGPEVFLFGRRQLDRSPYCRYVTFSYRIAKDGWTRLPGAPRARRLLRGRRSGSLDGHRGPPLGCHEHGLRARDEHVADAAAPACRLGCAHWWHRIAPMEEPRQGEVSVWTGDELLARFDWEGTGSPGDAYLADRAALTPPG